MTKEEFRRLAQSVLLFLDGATGSNLQKQGMPVGVCPELWITEHEEIMSGLQKAYLEAGTNILYAPTFTANRIKLKEFDLEDRIEELNHKLVEISKRAADGKALVAGDLTMTGQQLKPMGPLDFEELIDVYKEQIRYITEAGADLLVVETMMSLQESRAALIAAKETCPDIPVMVTMTFESDGRSLFGTDAATAAIVLSSLGADAVGANCSTGPDQMAEVIRRMAKVTDIPIIAKPNAGLPSLDEKGQTVYDMGPEEFGADMELLLDAGAQILGGCCGTTPEHIRKMTHRLAGRPVPVHGNPTQRALTSERASLTFDLDGPFLIVGERINPTGKKKLQQELREGSFELVTQFAQEQEERGASILDVNMGMSGIDEKAMMLQALEEVAGVTKLPLSIDSSHVDVQEEALRRYPGRALINSISLESEKFEKLLPLAEVLTPNIPEAEILSGMTIANAADMEAAARTISQRYGCAVLCKGGHQINDADDLLWRGGTGKWFKGKRIANPNTHGTGCTLSSAIASNLAKGYDLDTAVERAKAYISGCLSAMLDLGHGSGPMDHTFNLKGDFVRD